MNILIKEYVLPKLPLLDEFSNFKQSEANKNCCHRYDVRSLDFVDG
jgi:hypothetical protein